jgi:hypothetical protein
MRSGCLGILGIILFLAVIAIIRGITASDPEMIRMNGEAVMSASAARAAFGDGCQDSARLYIVPSEGDVAIVEIERATQRPNGSCAFAFAGDVPDADTYTFEMDGVNDLTIPRSTMDTVGPDGSTTLSVRLSW